MQHFQNEQDDIEFWLSTENTNPAANSFQNKIPNDSEETLRDDNHYNNINQNEQEQKRKKKHKSEKKSKKNKSEQLEDEATVESTKEKKKKSKDKENAGDTEKKQKKSKSKNNLEELNDSFLNSNSAKKRSKSSGHKLLASNKHLKIVIFLENKLIKLGHSRLNYLFLITDVFSKSKHDEFESSCSEFKN